MFFPFLVCLSHACSRMPKNSFSRKKSSTTCVRRMEDPVTIRLPHSSKERTSYWRCCQGGKMPTSSRETMELDSNANHMMEQEMWLRYAWIVFNNFFGVLEVDWCDIVSYPKHPPHLLLKPNVDRFCMILDLKIHEHSMNHLLFCQGYSFHHLWTRLQISNPFAASKKCQLFQVFPCCCCLWELIQLLLSWKRLDKVYSIIFSSFRFKRDFINFQMTSRRTFFLDFHDLVQRLRFFRSSFDRSISEKDTTKLSEVTTPYISWYLPSPLQFSFVLGAWNSPALNIWRFSPFGRPCVTGPTGPFTRTRGRGFATTCKWIAGKCCKNRSRHPSKLSRK